MEDTIRQTELEAVLGSYNTHLEMVQQIRDRIKNGAKIEPGTLVAKYDPDYGHDANGNDWSTDVSNFMVDGLYVDQAG